MWRIARWPLALLLLGFLVLLAVNAFDERLSPQAQAMLRAPDNPYSDEQNLYVLLAGMNAPAGESMLDHGRQNIREFAAKLAAGPGAKAPATIATSPRAEPLRIETGSVLWNKQEKSVWDMARDDAQKFESLATRYQELLGRYEALHGSMGYVETLRPVATAPFFSAPRDLRTLYLADLAVRIRSGKPAEQTRALQSLAADLTLWQRMLQGEGGLLSKMVAIGNIRADLLLLSDLVADPAVPLEVVAASMGLWLAPLPVDDWKIGKVFASDFRQQAEIFQSLYENADLPPPWQPRLARLASWSYLPNATLNVVAARAHALSTLSDTDLATLPQRMRAFDADRIAALSISFPTVLRNPVGKVLLRMATPAYADYPIRAFDVAAVQRAVALAYQIRAQDVAPADVPVFMREHPEWATHPLGNAPLVWNAETLELRVPQQVQHHRAGRFAVRVARTRSAAGQALAMNFNRND
jgi:hypothetical protein